VTNVTNFGAFVDVGVHQDGLVHISALSDKFVKDPHTVVKAGDVVRVKVLEVDEQRKRIALTMRLQEAAAKRDDTRRSQPSRQHKPAGHVPASGQDRPPSNAAGARRSQAKAKGEPRGLQAPAREKSPGGAMAEALARALKRSQG
jgi:uncharacterized protein